jgi:hypothetical protein
LAIFVVAAGPLMMLLGTTAPGFTVAELSALVCPAPSTDLTFPSAGVAPAFFDAATLSLDTA